MNKRQKTPHHRIQWNKRGAIFQVIIYRVYGAIKQNRAALLSADAGRSPEKNGNMKQYLEVSKYLDWNESNVSRTARALADGLENPVDVASRCFDFVRDEIKHSWDYQLNPVTCKASDVLVHKTGYCYAKSHLLAALLRANGIPAGLCYQRLTIANDEPPFCIHGLNAVYLNGLGWYRVDARGNKPGVNAVFNPPNEQLAFQIINDGEADFMEIWPSPLQVVIEVLESSSTYIDVANNLPDIQIVTAKPAWLGQIFSSHPRT